MATFESMDRRMPKIEACLKANGLESLDACNEMLLAKGIDCDKIVRGVQPICFDNAVWASTSAGQARSIILEMASWKISQAALRINRQITTLATGSSTGMPRRAPSTPAKLPMEERASERWCQASAIRAEDSIFLAAARVYQYMPSLDTMDTTAAISASCPGTTSSPASPKIFWMPAQPIPAPVAASITESRIAATHSNRSCPKGCS